MTTLELKTDRLSIERVKDLYIFIYQKLALEVNMEGTKEENNNSNNNTKKTKKTHTKKAHA